MLIGCKNTFAPNTYSFLKTYIFTIAVYLYIKVFPVHMHTHTHIYVYALSIIYMPFRCGESGGKAVLFPTFIVLNFVDNHLY